MMRLYYAPGTCALACWISLEWAGAEYSVEKVDPHSESYRRINPLGMVPAVDVGGVRAMTQADAILQYIASLYPGKKLGPSDDLDDRFEFNETMSFLTGDFHPAFWPYFSPQRFSTDAGTEALKAVKEASYPRIARVLEHLDALIGDEGHVWRDRRTVADSYAFVMARWSEKLPASWRDFPHLAAFMESMSADPDVRRVLAQSSQA